MGEAQLSIDTWYNDADEETAMTHDHLPYWMRMIELSGLSDLRSSTVLDYGCNQGGFLRELYRKLPFERGIGCDIAESSLEIARSERGSLPVEYLHLDNLKSFKNSFDAAFSHEVVYLLPDLSEHAELIHSLLKERGAYFFSTGCHTANPLWDSWQRIIRKSASVAAQNYAPEDFAHAFRTAGFEVEIEPFKLKRDPSLYTPDQWFPSETEWNEFYNTHKLFFKVYKR